MSKLKYGKVFISEYDIISALKLTEDTHLELINNNTEEGIIEFAVVASGVNEHEWLISKPDHGISNMRRVRVPFKPDNEEWTITPQQIEESQKFANLLLTWSELGFNPHEAIEIIKSLVDK